MGHQVSLVYFRPSGKYLTHALALVDHDELEAIWEEIHELRRIGRLPGLRVNSGRDLTILVDVPDHPHRKPYIAFPASVEEEDVTPIRVPTGEMEPIVKLHMESIPASRTSTKDVVKQISEDEITPVDPIKLPIKSEP